MAEVELGWSNARLQAGARGAEAIVSRTTAGMQASFSRMRGINMGALIGGVSLAAFGAAAKSVIQVTAEFDSLERGLLSVEGTQEGVTERLKELKEVAALPGLGMQEAIQGDIRLRSVGLSADLSKRSLIEMGNALANVGGGKAELDGVLLALTQIVSKGKVSAEEINQIAERVPQVRAVMKDVFGTADTEAIQKMKISSEQFIQALIDGFEKKVPRATVGLKGSMEALEDAVTESIVTMGKPLGEVLIPQFQQLGNLLEKNQDKIGSFATGAATFTEGMFEMTKGVIALTIGLKGLVDGEGFQEKVKWAWGEMHLSDPPKKPDEKKPSDGDGKGGQFTPPSEVKTESEIKALEAARLSLGEKQYEVMMSHTSALLQSENLLRRIKDLQEKAANLTGTEHELERLKIQEQIIDLQTRERAIRKGIRDDAERAKQKQEEEAKQAREVEARRQQELARLNAELAIIDAQNAGLQKKADAMRRNLEIAEQAARIQERTGISQAEAIKKATALVDGQAKANSTGDGKRQGTAAERQEAARQRQADRQANADQARKDAYQRAYPGLDDWKAKQGKPLRDEFQFPGLDRYNALQDRSRPVGAPMPAANGKPAATQDMPTVENLLQQLINTTEGLKEG